MLFLARLHDLQFGAGAESLEVRLFAESEIPWDEIAFRTISFALKKYFVDRATGVFVPVMDKIIR
jgi:hypothetical protein